MHIHLRSCDCDVAVTPASVPVFLPITSKVAILHPALMNLVTIPSLMRLFGGGLAGLLIWEIWARVFTKAVLGYPLEPAGLIDAILNHNFGIAAPWLLREAMHYCIGIVGYPIAYLLISRSLKNWSFWLDLVTAITFTSGIAYYFATGRGTSWHALFLVIVLAFIASRFINRNDAVRGAIAWGTFTWFNALGLMAPLGGLSFYLLEEGGQLSFMSFAGHVIYGAVAAWLFERWEAQAAS